MFGARYAGQHRRLLPLSCPCKIMPMPIANSIQKGQILSFNKYEILPTNFSVIPFPDRWVLSSEQGRTDHVSLSLINRMDSGRVMIVLMLLKWKEAAAVSIYVVGQRARQGALATNNRPTNSFPLPAKKKREKSFPCFFASHCTVPACAR